ncbi:DUF6894 family protein [Muricoccus radiodurans]|uniref:DUF6894 family protein n=1 Tax=Muricoccus radiodurans TaxID=2231721 RepID=UPI003CF49B50
MPHFFFDTSDGEHSFRDEEGMECCGAEAARIAALNALPGMVRDVMPDGNRRDLTVNVRSEAGRSVFTVTLSLVAQWLDEGNALGP